MKKSISCKFQEKTLMVVNASQLTRFDYEPRGHLMPVEENGNIVLHDKHDLSASKLVPLTASGRLVT
jgi:hypothetical protein